MAKLGSVSQHSTNVKSDVAVSLCSLGVILCLVVAVVGIKFRWFKKRIHFDQIPAGSNGSDDNAQVILRRTSRNFQEQICEPVVAQGIFRKKLDEDIIIERPKTLPPVRVENTFKGPTAFIPPKRNIIPATVVEEPIVIPPPPPPLPSASSLSLPSLVGLSNNTMSEEKVNFSPSVQIIPNGDTKVETIPINTDEDHISRQLSERKQTGYIRPSDEIIAELQKLSAEVSNKQQFEDETQEPTSIDILQEKPKEKFKKNTSKSTKITTIQHNTEEELPDARKLGHRRPTGIFPSSEQDLEDYRDLFDDDSDHNPLRRVMFQVDDIDDEEKAPLKSPPILFSSQISEDDEPNKSESWSAIQRHRNLTQEIEEHQEVSTKKEELTSVQHNQHPLPSTQTEKSEPKTMPDMKRNNARNDLLFNSERDYNEA